MESIGIFGHILFVIATFSAFNQAFAFDLKTSTAFLTVNASKQAEQKIPGTLFGIFFEEINHAGAGGLWAELVSNRGFEAGGSNTPSNIDPWSVVGNESNIILSTDRSSCFERNKVALRMDILCDVDAIASDICPDDGVGIYNPGFWGMNIEQGESYKIILHVRSLQSTYVSVSLRSSDGLQILASNSFMSTAFNMWSKVNLLLISNGTNRNARLQLTTKNKGVLWFDQISVMPLDTYKGHGFRKDLYSMVAELNPQFLRFPGGCFVEGEWLRNAFRWRETIGPWEKRAGHFGDVWKYWTDDGLGYYEFLQLAEDLGAAPIWVFNNGISHNDDVHPSNIQPFVQDILDSIEFARGDRASKWGAIRASMGHPDPFSLEYVAIGNEDCWKKNYEGNYLKFYYAIKDAYPDIKVISNCDGSTHPIGHPADLYDYHVYTNADSMFSMSHQFDHSSRSGPKAFVSEYAVTGKDAGTGTLLAALAEAAFLMGLEKNSDVIEMASYAPLLVNSNDRRWNPDAIVFNSWEKYGTPSYWMQHFFKESSGAIGHPITIISNYTDSLMASAITCRRPQDTKDFLKIKIVNFRNDTVDLKISIFGLQNAINSFGSLTSVLTGNPMDENSFGNPNKIVPVTNLLQDPGEEMEIIILPYSLTSFDISLASAVQISAI